LNRNPGGSSGGTGAAIAANFTAAGMGSDTCGSIRIPASHNSLVGIRGTQGLASRTGIIPLSSTQDIGGPIARTVTDAAIMLDTIVSYDPADPQTAGSVGNIPTSYTDFLQLTGLRGARIGLLTALLGSDPADAEVASVVRGAVDEMKGQGAEVVEVTIPGLADLLTDRANGFLVLRQDFKFDLNAYLAAHPTAPARTSEKYCSLGDRDQPAQLGGGRIPRHAGIFRAHRQAQRPSGGDPEGDGRQPHRGARLSDDPPQGQRDR
jgi:Asp-tRNA(Asn)/Glu-tRNA(Gln) amidotransferase A subunit family amidase